MLHLFSIFYYTSHYSSVAPLAAHKSWCEQVSWKPSFLLYDIPLQALNWIVDRWECCWLPQGCLYDKTQDTHTSFTSTFQRRSANQPWISLKRNYITFLLLGIIFKWNYFCIKWTEHGQKFSCDRIFVWYYCRCRRGILTFSGKFLTIITESQKAIFQLRKFLTFYQF